MPEPSLAPPLADLDAVRAEIDRIDRAIVALLAERGGYVQQAARFKRTTDDVRAPARVEAVIAKVRALADAHGLDPTVAERVYRALIAAFIEPSYASTSGNEVMGDG